MPPLFDPGPRSDPSPSRPTETYFEFLNRVDTPYWRDVRDELESWCQELPDAEQYEMQRRFRSGRAGFASAFWELLLNRTFRAVGYEVEMHPQVQGGLTPDFRVVGSEREYLVEATVLMEPAEDDASERRLAPILEYLKGVESSSYFLGFGAIHESTTQPSSKALAMEIQEWLDGLPSPSGADPQAHSTSISDKGWRFEVRAVPKAKPGKGSGGIHMGPVRGRWVNDHHAMSEKLRTKARKYRGKGEPLILAIMNNRWSASIESEMVALYGAAFEHPQMLEAGRINPAWTNVPEGLWVTRSGIQYAEVVGVVTGFHIHPGVFFKQELRVWHPPWDDNSLRGLPLGHGFIDSAYELQVEGPTESFRHLLGLENEWPTGEPFPHANA